MCCDLGLLMERPLDARNVRTSAVVKAYMSNVETMNRLCRALTVSFKLPDKATAMTTYYSRSDALEILSRCEATKSPTPSMRNMQGAMDNLRKVRWLRKGCLSLLLFAKTLV